MTIRIGWGDEDQSYLYIQVIGKWTWEDYYETVDAGRRLTRELHRDHIPSIVNLSDSQNIPENPLPHLRRLLQNPYPMQGIIVMVDTPPFIRALMPAVQPLIRMQQQRIVMADSLEEALEIIEEQRHKLKC